MKLKKAIYRDKELQYWWNKFEYMVQLSFRYDNNSREYEIVNKCGWQFLDRYMKLLIKHK